MGGHPWVTEEQIQVTDWKLSQKTVPKGTRTRRHGDLGRGGPSSSAGGPVGAFPLIEHFQPNT